LSITIDAAYNSDLMLVNQRIREIRKYRRLEGRELARMAGLSASEVSHIERKLRNPKTDTLQKIAAALDVNTGYLLGEEDADLALPEGLALQSLKVFKRHSRTSPELLMYIEQVSRADSAPQTVKGWRDLLKNIETYSSQGFSATPKSS
jgi:transcriptional regulator with XRE-family HTH domain